MVAYYQYIPQAAVRFMPFDGKLYAYSNARLVTLPSGKVTVSVTGTEGARLLRVDPSDVGIRAGEARVRIGRAGDAIASTVNLPFGIEAVQEAR